MCVSIMRNRRGKTFRDEEDGFALETQAVFIDLYKTATANIYVVTVGAWPPSRSSWAASS